MLSKLLNWIDIDVIPDHQSCVDSNDWYLEESGVLYVVEKRFLNKLYVTECYGEKYKNIHTEETVTFQRKEEGNDPVIYEEGEFPEEIKSTDVAFSSGFNWEGLKEWGGDGEYALVQFTRY